MARRTKKPALKNLTEKPWGHEVLLVKNDLYVVKQLYIKAGHRLSLQVHKDKVEHITLVSGDAHIYLENEVGITQYQMAHMEPTLVPSGTTHRVMTPENSDAVLVEVSTPQLDDVLRLEDDYGRADVDEDAQPPYEPEEDEEEDDD